jgi:GH15 family glucan-1,4-alpha-glucosidase
MQTGCYGEAAEWRRWLLRAAAGSPEQVQIMYGLAGERRLFEWEITWLPGYEGSKPVRVGNAAAGQLQLDVYGEVMDALYQGAKANWSGRRVPGACRSRCSSIWRPLGASLTKAFGKRAVGGSTLPSPR